MLVKVLYNNFHRFIVSVLSKSQTSISFFRGDTHTHTQKKKKKKKTREMAVSRQRQTRLCNSFGAFPATCLSRTTHRGRRTRQRTLPSPVYCYSTATTSSTSSSLSARSTVRGEGLRCVRACASSERRTGGRGGVRAPRRETGKGDAWAPRPGVEDDGGDDLYEDEYASYDYGGR